MLFSPSLDLKRLLYNIANNNNVKRGCYLSFFSDKMATLKTSLDVCDFCLSYHKLYAPGHPFNDYQKIGVAHCSLCSVANTMCNDCYNNSLKELGDSILTKLGFAICRNCIVQYRRTTDIQEKVEAIAHKRISETQEKIRSDVYILTHSLQ